MFTTNIRELPGATLHPLALQSWRRRSEDWLSTRRASRPPAPAMNAYAAGSTGYQARPVFVTDTADPDYLFLYWYLQRFTGRWPFASTRGDAGLQQPPRLHDPLPAGRLPRRRTAAVWPVRADARSGRQARCVSAHRLSRASGPFARAHVSSANGASTSHRTGAAHRVRGSWPNPSTVLRRAIHASTSSPTAEFDVLWEWPRAADPPSASSLQLASPGRTHAERRAVQAAAWQGLRERAVAGPDGPDPELARLLHLLARPGRAAGAAGVVGPRGPCARGRPARCRRARGPREADSVTVTACGSLPVGLPRGVPAGRPRSGPGRARCRARCSRLPPVTELRPALIGAGVHPARQRCSPRWSPAPDGGRRSWRWVPIAGASCARAGGVLGVLDGPRGRYLLTRSTGRTASSGSPSRPADPRRLRHLVAGLLPPWPPATSGRPAPGRPPPRPPRPPR